MLHLRHTAFYHRHTTYRVYAMLVFSVGIYPNSARSDEYLGTLDYRYITVQYVPILDRPPQRQQLGDFKQTKDTIQHLSVYLSFVLEWESIINFTPHMMTSSNGNIFRVTGPLCGEFTGPGEFPAQRPVTRSFDVFFDTRLNKRLSKQPWGWWFETPEWSLWRHHNDFMIDVIIQPCRDWN